MKKQLTKNQTEILKRCPGGAHIDYFNSHFTSISKERLPAVLESLVNKKLIYESIENGRWYLTIKGKHSYMDVLQGGFLSRYA